MGASTKGAVSCAATDALRKSYIVNAQNEFLARHYEFSDQEKEKSHQRNSSNIVVVVTDFPKRRYCMPTTTHYLNEPPS